MSQQRDDLTFPTRLPRRGVLLAAAGLAAPFVMRPAAAQAPAGKPPAKPTGQVIVGFSQEPTVFHPLMNGDTKDQAVWWNLFSTLWKPDPTGKFVPVLATELPTVENGGLSADGLEWKVKLRDDATWHDGKPVTAEDVKFTIELIQNPKFRAAARAGHMLVENLTVHPGNVLTWRMKEPFSPYMATLSFTFIVPRHILADAEDPNNAPFNAAPIGSGAFKWGERKTGSTVTLLANPHYFGKGPYLERLVFQYVPDLNALYLQFASGQIDHIGIQGVQPQFLDQAKAIKNATIYMCPQGAVENLTLNLGRPALAEKAVRQALYYAIDKDAIIDGLYYGVNKPAETYLSREHWAYNPNLPAQVHDPKKAIELLEGAGWKPGPDGIRQKNGVRLEFSNSTTTGNQTRESAQQLLQQDFAKIGVSMSIKNLPGAVLWAEFWRLSQFDSLMTQTTYSIASDPDVTHRFGSGSIPVQNGNGSNVSQYKNAEVDKLLAIGRTEFDREKRRAAYLPMQALIRDDLPFLPIFEAVQIEGTKAGLKGFVPNPNILSNAGGAADWYWG